jgi:hypothetical protein
MKKKSFLIPKILGILFAVSVITACSDFPDLEITTIDLSGLIKPAEESEPSKTLDIRWNAPYSSGEIMWYEGDSEEVYTDEFKKYENYKAVFNLTAKEGYIFNVSKNSFYKEPGIDIVFVVDNTKKSVRVTAAFSEVDPPADDDDISIGTPVNLTYLIALPRPDVPPALYIDQKKFSGTIEWEPKVELGSNGFENGKVYTAKVTLTAKANFLFQDNTVFTHARAETNDVNITVSNEGKTASGTITFPTTVAPPPKGLGYTAVANEAFPTTLIILTFDEDVDLIERSQVSISGTASLDTGFGRTISFIGTKKTWGIPINDKKVTTGTAYVEITHDDIRNDKVPVLVYEKKADKDGYTFIKWTAAANGTADSVTTTQLAFTFDSDPGSLTARNFVITDGYGAVGGAATNGGELTGSGTTRTLTIDVTKGGFINVNIVYHEVDPAPKNDVQVHKAPDQLTNAAPPTFTTHPQSASYGLNETPVAALTVVATSPDGGTISAYQWYWNTTNSNASTTNPISGATTASYTPPVDVVGTRYYFVAVTNTNNNVSGTKTATAPSNVATIKVNPADAAIPVITSHPQDATYAAGATAVTALRVTAARTDGGTLSYQWYSGASATANPATDTKVGTNSDSFTPTTPLTAGTFYYYVVVTNTNNDETATKTATATSDVATITVAPAPTDTLTSISITTFPTKNTYNQGDSVFVYTGLVITATYSGATGTQTITYDTADAATKAKFSVQDFVTSTPGSVTVKIAFTDTSVTRTGDFPITVAPAPTDTLTSISITTYPTKNTYNQGDSVSAFDFTGLVITATYSVTGTQTITYDTANTATKDKFSVQDFVTSSPGSVTVKIAFTDTSVTRTGDFSITVNATGGDDDIGVTVKFNKPEEDEIKNLPDITGTSLPITVTIPEPNTYTSYTWFVDDDKKTTTGNELTITLADFPDSTPLYGTHTVTAIVEVVKDLKSYYYSKTLTFKLNP